MKYNISVILTYFYGKDFQMHQYIKVYGKENYILVGNRDSARKSSLTGFSSATMICDNFRCNPNYTNVVVLVKNEETGLFERNYGSPNK